MWPLEPIQTYQHDDDVHDQAEAPPDQEVPGHEPAHAAIAEMAALLRETRGNMQMNGGLLSAIVIGIALEAAFSTRVLRPGLLGLISAGLLCGLVCCWLTAVALLALAGRPALNSLSELRWGTGAPTDPRAGWLTLPALGANPDQWTWSRAHLLLGAARLARHRIQLADTWTCITVACFLVWTTAIILGL
jgi:hypothetical protein